MMETMTDKQKEIAARALCKARGQNPEQLVGHGAEPNVHGYIPAVMLHSPAWRLALREIDDHERMEMAMKAGRDAEQ